MKAFPNVKPRRLVVRAALVVAYIALAALLFVTGRGHTILVDNKADPAGAYAALKGAVVAIDREKPMEFYPGDRDKFVVTGQRHTIRVKLLSGPGAEEKSFEFRVPFGEDMTLLSIAKLMAGVEPWTETFVPPTALDRAAERAAEDEQKPTEGFGP